MTVIFIPIINVGEPCLFPFLPIIDKDLRNKTKNNREMKAKKRTYVGKRKKATVSETLVTFMSVVGIIMIQSQSYTQS